MPGTGFHTFAEVISRLCGWLYFLFWSLSFYPQPWKNLRRRTTQGLTPDFPFLNVVGFSCYTLSTAVFLFSPLIRAQYAARHPASPEPTVRPNDLAFGLHACVLVVITYSQFYPSLWGWKRDTGAKLRATTMSLVLVGGSAVGIAASAVMVLASGGAAGKDDLHVPSRRRAWEWIDVVYAISYVKLLLTVFKYLPQLVENFRRKSTVGWSIWQVLLDFFGGILSLVQLVIDSALQDDWSGLTGNPAKYGLAAISIIFDIAFILQHYVLYRAAGEKEEDREENVDDRRYEVLTDPPQGQQAEREPLLPSNQGRR